MSRLNNKEKLFGCFFIIALNFFSAISLALSGDNKQPIQIDAEHAECRQQSLSCVYSGDVKFTQGSNYLRAPKISIFRSKFSNNIDKIIASGNPAYFRTMLDNAEFSDKQKKMLVNAQADTIEIYPVKGLIVLLGNAEITEEKNKFNGEDIEYDMNKQTILSKPSNNSRTVIVLQPQGKTPG